MNTAPIHKIIDHSLVDGPGNRTAIFVQGCNLRCVYCHNPETQEFCPLDSSSEVQWMTAEDVFQAIEKNLPFIRGITVSGGECTLYPAFLRELFTLCQAKNLTCLLDSNGVIDLAGYPELMAVCDGVMLDVKAWNQEIFEALTGGDNSGVKRNLRFLADMDKLEEVRIVCLPQEVDTEDVLAGIQSVLGDKVETTQLRLIKFRSHGVEGRLAQSASPSDEYMDSLKQLALTLGFRKIRIS